MCKHTGANPMYASTKELDAIYNCIRQLKHLERWELRIAFKSLYSKANFDKIKCSRKEISDVSQWINKHKVDCPFEILWSPDEDETYRTAKGGSATFPGNLCTANTSNIVVLPDGAVTICEQLYWNKNFLIGDINNNTLKEIWTSEKANNIWKREQKSINQNSYCSKCTIFDTCFNASNRCYANIMKAYGENNFDYPDPRCCHAPEFQSLITHL